MVPASPYLGCVGIFGVIGPCMGIPDSGTVMSDVKVHLVFWLPNGYSFAPGVANGDAQHMALVERLFNDLSGSETYDILTQYGDAFPQYASDPAHGYQPNRVGVAGSYVETRAFPHSPLSSADIEAEMTQAWKAKGWPRPASDENDDIYFVFTPVGVQTWLSQRVCPVRRSLGSTTTPRFPSPAPRRTAACSIPISAGSDRTRTFRPSARASVPRIRTTRSSIPCWTRLGTRLSIPFTVSGGTATYGKTATAPADFGGSTSGTLLFRLKASGLTGVTAQISIPIWADTRVESDESITITLGTPSGPVVLTRSRRDRHDLHRRLMRGGRRKQPLVPQTVRRSRASISTLARSFNNARSSI